MEYIVLGVLIGFFFFVFYRIGLAKGLSQDRGSGSTYVYYVEVTDNMILAYDENGKFLAQDPEHADLSMRIREIVPGYNFYLAMEKKDEVV